MTQEEYNQWFTAPSDVSKANILREAIRNAKKRANKQTRYSGYYKLRRKQLTAIVNSVDNSLDKNAPINYTGITKQ